MSRLAQAEIGALGAAAIGVLGYLLSRPTPEGQLRLTRQTSRRVVPRFPAGARQASAAVTQDASRKALQLRDAGRAVLSRTDPSQPGSVKAARRLNRAAGLLATSVLADSAVEHYRGSFQNRAMYTPLVTAALSLAVSAHGLQDERPGAHAVRDGVYALAGATGIVGTGFHIYNISKRPGGFSWLNLFYGAPLGAPFALVLSGLLGFTAERVRDNTPNVTPRIFGLPAGRAMAGLTALGMAGTVGEVGLLHFRGAYHNPAMYIAGDGAAHRRGAAWRTCLRQARCRSLVHAVVAAADRFRRTCRRRIPHLRRRPQHGRLAQLVAERAERPADPGAPKLHRSCTRRARRARVAGGSSRCLSAIPVTT